MSEIPKIPKHVNIKKFTVPEVRLKQRKTFNIERARKLAESIKNKKYQDKKKAAENRFLTPEKIVNSTRTKDNDRRRRNRQEKRISQNQIPLSCSNDLCLVILIRSTTDASHKTRMVLKDLRLKGLYQARFYKMTEELKKQLILAGPFVVYGKPSMATVTNLMNKKAYTLVYGFCFVLM